MTLRPVLIWMALLACAPVARSFEMYPVALKGGAYARETNVDLDAIVFQSEVDIGTCDLSKRRFTNGNYKPIHEAITRSAYKAVGRTIRRDSWLSPKIAGAIWNDDPEYLARKAWYYGGTKKSSYYLRLMAEQPEDPKDRESLTRRSHYEDLQFLHAMAPRVAGAEQTQKETKRAIYTWTRAMYEVATGVIDESNPVADTPLKAILPNYSCTGRYSHVAKSCTVLDLLDMSLFWRAEKDSICDDHQRGLGLTARQCVTRDLAIGALLHTVQDSYSASHVERDGGMVARRFFSYPNHRHCEGDLAVEKNRANINAALGASVQVLGIYTRGESWDGMGRYIASAFGVSDRERKEFDSLYLSHGEALR